MARLRNMRTALKPNTLPKWQGDACGRILDFLERIPLSQAQFLTVNDFAKALDEKIELSRLMSALSILSALPSGSLSMHGYIESLEGDVLAIPDEDFSHLVTTGELAHPQSGQMIVDPFNHVRVFYRLSGLL